MVRKEVKTYDLVRKLLNERPELRDSDKALIWAVWEAEGLAKPQYITRDAFLQAEHVETIRRTRQKLQENFPELRSTVSVQRAKNRKQASKGTFIYRERLPVFDNSTNTVKFI